MNDEPLIAVFIDFENLAYGTQDQQQGDFQIDLILKRLLEKGRIVYKRAYCDWSRFAKAVRQFHGHGIELIDIPQTRMSGKNSADIRMVVDALDLCYAKGHIDIFALISGDSDFSPLVSKLKENDKRVVGCGVKASTSDLLIANCDEFFYYDDLYRNAQKKPVRPRRDNRAENRDKDREDNREEAIDRLVEIILALAADYEPLWGSLVKQTLHRVYPNFNESAYGYRNFTDLLKAAQEQGLIDLDYDRARGNYKISQKQT
ncbi:MAG: NYN domain-containing protein [Candidatus Latescibacteria bacterium]|nr:NYN domain-containing protein [Candidatus Latescibacterota bacterium]